MSSEHTLNPKKLVNFGGFPSDTLTRLKKQLNIEHIVHKWAALKLAKLTLGLF
jgi:hypothetical protein